MVRDLTLELHSDLTQWRQDFHRNPELGFEEIQTAAKIAERLESFGIEVHSGIGGTGVVGVLQRGNGTGCIGLRADMDALPITEVNKFDYASASPGKMHACGHDGHTTMLLGAAEYLARAGQFDGRVIFVFQPNEEHGLGAVAMIEDDLLDGFGIREIYGMHNIPGMELGHFATRAGPITAAESLFEIEVNASGGHAALPHMGVDAIMVGAEIVGALQTIVSRKIDPSMNGVVSITEFITDGKRNVLPGHVVLKGDARALTPEVNDTIKTRMAQIVDGICAAHGVQGQCRYDTIFPPTINAAASAQAAAKCATALVGDDKTNGACAPKLFSEDFAHFAARRPGCFVLMGNGVEGSQAQPLHSQDYDFNDAALPVGASFWVGLVEQQLAEQGTGDV